jgi:membrane-associated phospholipid phosphatase
MGPGSGLSRRPFFLAALPLIVLAVVALPWDFRISAWLHQADWLPGDIRRAVLLAEVFAHGIGIAYILLTVAVLDPRGWPITLRVAACAYVPGLLATGAKQIVARQRPSVADFDGSVWSSFVGWLPAIRTDQFDEAFDYAVQSFPSGHTATGVGLAIGLSFAYPHGRWLFAMFAALAGLQRVVAGAHFPSDVFVGAAIACLVAPLFAPRKK